MPTFDRQTVESIVEDSEGVLSWDGDTVVYDPDDGITEAARFERDADGRWCLGDGEWIWSLDDE